MPHSSRTRVEDDTATLQNGSLCGIEDPPSSNRRSSHLSPTAYLRTSASAQQGRLDRSGGRPRRAALLREMVRASFSGFLARLAAFRRFLRASGSAPTCTDEPLEVSGELALAVSFIPGLHSGARRLNGICLSSAVAPGDDRDFPFQFLRHGTHPLPVRAVRVKGCEHVPLVTPSAYTFAKNSLELAIAAMTC